jgi:hypothetical protein
MKLRIAVILILVGTVLSGAAPITAQPTTDRTSSTLGQIPQSDLDQPLRSRIQAADFIFQGVVANVEYRMSDPSPEGVPQIPHTFVTFKVEKLLKGQGNLEFITLRFIGGDAGGGKILTVSHMPLFDVGDRDVLFVRRNGKAMCPLASCEEGRFRIIGNQLFTNEGRPLLLNNQGELVYGKAQHLEEVRTNRIGANILRQAGPERQNVQHREEKMQDQEESVLSKQPALNPGQFVGLINQRLQQIAQTGELQAQSIASVNVQDPFFAPLLKPTSSPIDPVPRSPRPTIEDRQALDEQLSHRR